jgi:hypothetical protein
MIFYAGVGVSCHYFAFRMLAAPSCLGVAMAKTEIPRYRTTAGPNSDFILTLYIFTVKIAYLCRGSHLVSSRSLSNPTKEDK